MILSNEFFFFFHFPFFLSITEKTYKNRRSSKKRTLKIKTQKKKGWKRNRRTTIKAGEDWGASKEKGARENLFFLFIENTSCLSFSFFLILLGAPAAEESRDLDPESSPGRRRSSGGNGGHREQLLGGGGGGGRGHVPRRRRRGGRPRRDKGRDSRAGEPSLAEARRDQRDRELARGREGRVDDGAEDEVGFGVDEVVDDLKF